ncbi:MAG: hypothetical protein IPJ08_17540 [Burkholderiales bacterium]|nr:hypothetical protein [Burkholderiales bacterium]
MDEALQSDFTDTPFGDELALSVLSGMPADRVARIAARRAFVDMKQLFIRAVAGLADRKGEWLREKVRLAVDPMDLWLLRGPVLAALHRNDDTTRRLRADLYRGLDHIFPGAFGLGHHATLSTRPPEPWEVSPALTRPGQSMSR